MHDAPLGPCVQVKGRRTAHDKEIYMFDGKEVDFKKVRAQEQFVEHCLLSGSCSLHAAQSPLSQAPTRLSELQLAWPTSSDTAWGMCHHASPPSAPTTPRD